jgi:WD40 repeat protein
VPSAGEYHAFISYSHQQDEWLAEGLQIGLERFAKPWYRMRALRVFLDTANLAASPQLWPSVEAALAASRWLILLASPSAADSAWVRREVAWWLDNKPMDRLLLVATRTELRWDAVTGDWSADSPVPPELRGVFTHEPLWVNLSGLARPDTSRGQTRVADEHLASLAAPLRGVERDALIGEHLRYFRRTIRMVTSVAVTLLLLLAVAVAATVIAIVQRQEAATAARIATAREYAALSGRLLTTNLRAATQFAVAAYQQDHDPQTRAALLQAAAVAPHLVRDLHVGETVTALAGSGDGRTLIAGTVDGRLVRFDLGNWRRVIVSATKGPIAMLSVSANGTALASDGYHTVSWGPGAKRVVPLAWARAPLDGLAISPSGRLLAVLTVTKSRYDTLIVRAAGGSERTLAPLDTFYDMGFPSESVLVLGDGAGHTRQLDPVSLRTIGVGSPLGSAAGSQYGTSPDGGYVGYSAPDSVVLWRVHGSGTPGRRTWRDTLPQLPDDLQIRTDGREAAILVDGNAYVSPLLRGTSAIGAVQLTSDGNIALVRFLGAGSRLATISGEREPGTALAGDIEIWDSGQVSRLSTVTGLRIPGSSGALAMVAPPHGELPWIAVDESGGWFSDGTRSWRRVGPPDNWLVTMRAGDKPVFVEGNSAGDLVLADSAGRVIRTSRSWRRKDNPVAGGMLPGGGRFALIGADGTVISYDIGSGTARLLAKVGESWAGIPDDRGQTAAISPDGGTAIVTQWRTASGNPGDVVFTGVGVAQVDLRTGATHVIRIGGEADGVTFGPDNDVVVQLADGLVEVWDRDGRRLVRTLPSAGATLPVLTVSADGRFLARLRQDGTVVLADLTTGEVLATLSLPPTFLANPYAQGATRIVFTSDSRYLLTATAGGHLIRWAVGPADLIRTLCATVGSDLSPALWRQYSGADPPLTPPCT